jgi:hypothetical protein
MTEKSERELDAMLGRSHGSTCRCAKDVPVLVAIVRAEDKLLEMATRLIRTFLLRETKQGKQCVECLVTGGHKQWCTVGKVLASWPIPE